MRSVKIGLFDIDFVPRTSWHRSIARLAQGSVWFGRKKIEIPAPHRLIFRKIWERIRRRELLRAGYKCEICGSSNRLHVHEIWDYNARGKIQKLRGYRVLCSSCHRVHHSSYLIGRGDFDFIVDYITEVNRSKGINIGRVTVSEKLQRAYETWIERSTYLWRIDISYEKYLEPLMKLADTFLNYWIYIHQVNSLDPWLESYCSKRKNVILLAIRIQGSFFSLRVSPRVFVQSHSFSR